MKILDVRLYVPIYILVYMLYVPLSIVDTHNVHKHLYTTRISYVEADMVAKLTVTLETEPGLTMSEFWSPLQVRQYSPRSLRLVFFTQPLGRLTDLWLLVDHRRSLDTYKYDQICNMYLICPTSLDEYPS